tara:strand:+ start:92 stop:610 length:519 start_codon:yes stop_codon:yes gene_type:complete
MSKQLSLNEKLFELRKEIGSISKDTKNPFYKSRYFDINSLIKQLDPLLEKHRLLLMQPIEEDIVMTKIMCLDNETGVVSGLKLPDIIDPQKLGSCITYYRRYTLASLLGLQSVDDDANLGSGKVVKEKPWLNENTPQFQGAIKFLKDGKTIEEIKTGYRISPKTLEALNAQL